MPLHPQARQFLDFLAAEVRPSRHTLTPQENRAALRRSVQFMGEVLDLPLVEDRQIPGPTSEIGIRVYRPAGNKLPALLYFHGGGWVTGDLDTHDRLCRSLAKYGDFVVVSVDYRLAPEHPFPAALDDCWSATRYLWQHSAHFEIDPKRLGIGGDSAGGNLAAVISRLARDEGNPKLAHQLLVYPVIDTDTSATRSYSRYAEGHYLTRDDMEYYFDHYLGEHDRSDPRVAPGLARDLAGLPSATMITAEFDILRDEAEVYARRLQEASVEVTLRRFNGMFHPFLMFAGVLDAACEAQKWAALRVREAFTRA